MSSTGRRESTGKTHSNKRYLAKKFCLQGGGGGGGGQGQGQAQVAEDPQGIHTKKEALLKSSACNLPPRGAEGREEENKR